MTKILPRQAFYKLVATSILLCLCLYHFSKAQTFAKNQDDTNGSKKVSITVNDVSINEVLKVIKRLTGLSPFMAGQTVEELKQKVSLDVKEERVDHVLQELLGTRGYTFQFNDNVIIIRKRESIVPIKKNENDSSINTTTLTGKVTDAVGTPLIGATVMVKGTNDGAVTDAEGNFTLPNVNKKATVMVRSVGYETREIPVKGQRIMVQLNVVVNDLDETVVIAYGTTTKRYNTGNVSTIKAKDIEKQPVNNPLLALQGRVPGVTIEQATGLPGSGITVRIQGANSLKSGNDPLYVIDGVPYTSRVLATLSAIQGSSGGNAPDMASSSVGTGNPLSFINPSDIESIDILKDADATSIYGSRAANGAILITTKKGKAGQTIVNFNIQNGWGSVARKVRLLNTEQYLTLRKEAYMNDGIPVPSASTPKDQSNLDLTFYDQGRYTDWQDVLIGNTAQYTDVTASVSGGTNLTQFLINTGFHRETTVFPGDLSDNRGSLHLSLNNTSPNQRFKVSFSANIMMDNNKLIAEDITSQAMRLAPNAPELYDEEGKLNWAMLPNGEASWRNPLAYLQQKYNNKTLNLIGNATLSYSVLPGLDIRSSFGYTNLRSDETLVRPLSSEAPQDRPFSLSSTQISSGVIRSWIVEPQISYRKAISNGVFDVLIGGTIQDNLANRVELTGSGYTTEELLGNVEAAANRSARNGASQYKYSAVFGRINYNWANRYIATVSARRDGSSRFGSENLFNNFGSVAGAWIFSNEGFVRQSFPFLSFGKIKASYGTSGNDGIGEYRFLSLYENVFSVLPYQGTNGLEPAGIPNPYLQWEETRKFSAGVELGFFKDRILITANYYRNRSSNQLVSYQLPIIAGFGSIFQNLDAVVQNKGWELSLNATNLQTENFNWSTSINLTIPRNKLVSYPDLENSPYAYDYIVGKPIGASKVYQFVGVDPTSGLYQVLDKEGKVIPVGSFGSLDDRGRVIDLTPKYYGGFQNTFRYKNFELDLLFQFVKQQGAYNYLESDMTFWGKVNIGNRRYEVLNRWQNPGDVSSVQRVYTFNNFDAFIAANNAAGSTATILDASYIRLKNLSFSWVFPTAWMQKIHLKNGRIFLHGQNLLTITGYKGLDPETKTDFSVPPLRVITMGINVSF